MQPPGDPKQLIIHRRAGDPNRVERIGPYGIESLIDLEEEDKGTVYRVRIEPGERTGVNYHRRAEEYYYVLAGRGTAILNGQDYALEAGKFLRLPPGTTHGFVTTAEPLEMLNIHTPGCRPDRDLYRADA